MYRVSIVSRRIYTERSSGTVVSEVYGGSKHGVSVEGRVSVRGTDTGRDEVSIMKR